MRVALSGHFQVGKSTLINCLLRKRIANTGDSTTPTTAEDTDYVSPCGGVVFVDTPGVNAEESHDSIVFAELKRADIVLFVTKSTSALSQPSLSLLKQISRSRIPVVVAINCWDDRSWHDGDPEKANPTIIETIRHQLIGSGIKVLCMENVNIEWVAAARGCLDDRRTLALKRSLEVAGDSALRCLESRGRVKALEQYLMPHPLEGFRSDGMEAGTLVTKLFKKWGALEPCQ